MTGSTTRYGMVISASVFATQRMMSAENNMPVFAAAIGNPSHTVLSCRETISGSVAATPVTPSGFCAVIQVITVVPKTPRA